jgi:ubiquinone/menaquinone biosynthesis C-methylase UbiE
MERFDVARARTYDASAGGNMPVKTREKPPGAGRSSFDLIDRERFFHELPVTKSTVLLDLGCGRGEYTIPIAQAIGPQGKVYGLDAWEEGIIELRRRVSDAELKNVKAMVADIKRGVPLENAKVDLCLMATVLHDLLQDNTGEVALREMARVLKPDGKLVIIEYKKVESDWGPPVAIRLSEQEVEETIRPFGFQKVRASEVGPYHYLFVASLGAPFASY